MNVAAETTLPVMALDPEMAKQLKEAGVQLGKWTKRRDDLIRKACASGASYRAVGEAVGLSHTAVAFIVRGRPSQEERHKHG